MLATTLDDARQALLDVWGYDSFRPLQADAVADVIAGRDSLVVLPTGGGKSLCYQVPALVRDGLAVVVSPLISLMKDQVDALVGNGVAAALVNSSQNDAEKLAVADQIRRGELKILYLAPERLLTERTLRFLETADVSFFAIDEAHCVSAWGHDFRPEYRGLSILRDRFPKASVHAFTATASELVRDDIAQQLQLRDPSILVGNFDRPNLVYRFLRSDGKLNQIQSVIEQHRGESGIVYCISRREVEQTATSLRALGIDALPYHAGLDDGTRKANQDKFIREETDVMVATVAFGMGIDKSNVRFVIHAGMPKSIEHYQQESGRAGRDGLPADCVLIYSGGDVVTWKRILDNESSNQSSAHASLDAMAAVCCSVTCRHASLVNYFGQEFDAENCGACDVCLGELDLVDDPLTLAQKILSCVIRLQERFGVAYTVKVLNGSRESKIVSAGHDRLSTFGLLGDESGVAIRTWIEQLIGQGFLERTGEYQTLRLTDSGRELLHRRGTVSFTRIETKRGTKSFSQANHSWDGVDRGLFDQLRQLRSRLAGERGVPAYVIFGDATLMELARIRPTTLASMGRVRGIGNKKLEELGQTFLSAIDEHCAAESLSRDQSGESRIGDVAAPASKPITSSAVTAFEMFRNGDSVATVAEKMSRAPSTVHGYLTQFLQVEAITDPTPWVDAAVAEQILAALPVSEDRRLKPVFDHLEGKVSYEDIRIVAACHANLVARDQLSA